MDADKKKTRKTGVNIMKASYLLQGKIGPGPLDEKKVRKSQEVIDGNTVDFAPMAEDFLNQLGDVIAFIRTEGTRGDLKASLESLREPVMLLKGNAGMFNYPLVTKLAGVMLSFLEAISTIDSDVIDIVEAHHKTLKHIIRNKMSGDGGEYGADLVTELKNACKRYLARRTSGEKTAEDGAFFVEF